MGLLIKAEKAKENFSCEICDFQSKGENGLATHMANSHAQLEQLNGSSPFSEDYEATDKYTRTLLYWKEEKMGNCVSMLFRRN